MAMPRPNAVAMECLRNAAGNGAGALSSPPMSENEPIMPVTVPSKPSSGASVITVSRMGMPALKRLISCS